ncbi:MAG: class I SAM-dependent rRNA methyltransferase [Planctomycetes bacterium]|nr:class I SAM-dependent rRNA methyltransferase [Planctomycetota bacterium]
MTLTGKGRRWVAGGHPWIYKDDIADGKGETGELIPVFDPANQPVGWGLFSTTSRIAIRMVTRSPEQPNREFWKASMEQSLALRTDAGLMDPAGACRLIAGDADGFPGWVVDRYTDVLVVQCTTQGAERMRDFLLEVLKECLPFEPRAILDRSDAAVRKLEDLDPRVAWIEGSSPGLIEVQEGPVRYLVDVEQGHKTGAYLDQSQNHQMAARFAQGQRVLDAFAYDGLFGLHAAVAGAHEVVCMEQSQAACDRILANAKLNGVEDRIRIEKVNCMQAMRDKADAGERFGLVVVDPPAFARNRKESAGAERGYVELGRRAFAMCDPGATLVYASCSYNVRPEEFLDYVRKGARLADRDGWLMSMEGPAADHPQLLSLPETRYLKCAFLRVHAPSIGS